MRKIHLFLLVFIFVLSACATSPTGRTQLKLMGEAQMDSLGDSSFEQMLKKTPTENSAKINDYVACITNSLLQAKGENPKDWKVKVFKDESANAFALPGKNIGVHTGILKVATRPEELAAVIGHEIAHVDVGHGNERISQTLIVQGGLTAAQIALGTQEGNQNSGLILAGLGLGAQFGYLLPFSRKHETEADILGQQYMAKAGFDPQGSISLWQKMGQGGKSPPEFMSTHPNSDSRIKALKDNLAKTRKVYFKVQNKPVCKL